MRSTTSTTCVHDASLASRNPRLEEIERPEAHRPANPVCWAMAADSASCASMRKLTSGEERSGRSPVRSVRSAAAPEPSSGDMHYLQSLEVHRVSQGSDDAI